MNKNKREFTKYDKAIGRLIAQGKGWTDAISEAYGVTRERARQIYRSDFEDSANGFESMSLYVNKLLNGSKRAYVYLPKPPIPDVEDENAQYKAKYEIFWAEHPLQGGVPLEICEKFISCTRRTRYKHVPSPQPETPSNKFFEVKEEMDPLNHLIPTDEKKTYDQEPGNQTERQEDVTNNFLIKQLKDLYLMAVEDKRYKEAKDCLELLGRIGGQIGEKVKKESVVTTKSVSEASEEFLHASKVLGLDLPKNVTNIFEAQRKIK